ncbi:MAG: hypothetical protein NC548_24700 [Lachnospiraceae bacterium]|nr:hypothetical protein [Lachnospiraceae bacterium]
MMIKNKVLSFGEFINEGFLSKTINRAKTGDVRKESGKKVNILPGVDIVIADPNLDYMWFVKEICNGHNNHYADYRFTLDSKGYESTFKLSNNIMINFPDYDMLVMDSVTDEDEICREDYESIIGGIKQFMEDKELMKCENKWYFKLIPSEVYFEMDDNSDKFEDEDDNTLFENFYQEFYNKFSQDKGVYMFEHNIILEINYETMSNFLEITDFTNAYFGV